MPPVTPSNTWRPARGPDVPASPGAMGVLLRGCGLETLEGDLAFGDLSQGDGQWLGAEALDQRRHELAAALAELAVVRVDLPGPLGGQDDQRVARIDPLEQL